MNFGTSSTSSPFGKPKKKSSASVPAAKTSLKSGAVSSKRPKKAKASVIEEPEIKTKKIKPKKAIKNKDVVSSAVALVPEETPLALVRAGQTVRSLTKRQNKKLRTMFGNNSDTILDLLENNDHDGAQTMIYRALLQTLVDVLPLMEGTIRKSKGQRGAYQLNQTVSQIRETLADVQAARDKSQFGAHLAERHVQPAFLLLAQQYALSIMEIENAIDRYMDARKAREFRETVTQPMKVGMSTYMRDQLQSIMTNIAQAMS